MSLVQYLSVLVDECAGDYSGIAGFRFSSKSNIETQLHPRLRSFIGQVSEVVVASGANPIPPAARQQFVDDVCSEFLAQCSSFSSAKENIYKYFKPVLLENVKKQIAGHGGADLVGLPASSKQTAQEQQQQNSSASSSAHSPSRPQLQPQPSQSQQQSPFEDDLDDIFGDALAPPKSQQQASSAAARQTPPAVASKSAPDLPVPTMQSSPAPQPKNSKSSLPTTSASARKEDPFGDDLSWLDEVQAEDDDDDDLLFGEDGEEIQAQPQAAAPVAQEQPKPAHQPLIDLIDPFAVDPDQFNSKPGKKAQHKKQTTASDSTGGKEGAVVPRPPATPAAPVSVEDPCPDPAVVAAAASFADGFSEPSSPVASRAASAQPQPQKSQPPSKNDAGLAGQNQAETARLQQRANQAEEATAEPPTNAALVASSSGAGGGAGMEEALQVIQGLRQKLKQFKEHANARFGELNQELEQVRSENQLLRQQQSTRAPVSDGISADEAIALQQQLQQVTEENTRLRRQLDQSQARASEQLQLKEARQQLGEAQSHAIQLQAELHQSQMEQQVAQAEVGRCQESLAQAQAQVRSLQGELAEVQADQQSQAGNTEQAVREAVQRYKSQATARFQELQEELQAAQAELEASQAQFGSLQKEFRTSEGLVGGLQEELAQARQQAAAARQSAKLQDQRLAELRHQLQEAEAEAERQAAARDSRLQKLQAQLAQSRQDLEQARAGFAEERAGLHQQVAQLLEQAERNRAEASQHDIEAAVRAYKEAASARFDQMRKETARLATQLEEKERELAETGEQLRAANTDLEEIRVAHTQGQQQLLILRRSLQSMEGKLQSQVELSSGEGRRVQQLEAEVHRLEEEVTRARREAEEALRKVQKQAQATQLQRSTDLARIQELDHELSRHIDHLSQAKLELAKASDSSKRHQRQAELLTQKYAELHHQWEAASQQLARVSQERDAILERSRRYVSKTSEERQREREQLQAATAELTELRTSHAEAQGGRAELADKFGTLEREHAALQDRLGKYVQQNRQREQQQTVGKRDLVQKTIQRLYQALTTPVPGALIEEEKVYDGHQVLSLLRKAIKITLTPAAARGADRGGSDGSVE